ncbi:MAG: hypothetical protein US42_C0011G0059 [Candidatus Magasanikbacteria bacterium GW2011_GWC2_37_14]|uniref:Uncharacterized protein n=1 Tax=Candidatus Magasanikbacteria bacterium GW2011_GWC2_37_14 TaxID=1619046 RepID=A0A0G0JGU4_9BACT|nr:MAG: hypothetical protein US42_C0011G0059 [Candidatus Magasanikbacteria bacterium GW2011_GWC2_37_14]
MFCLAITPLGKGGGLGGILANNPLNPPLLRGKLSIKKTTLVVQEDRLVRRSLSVGERILLASNPDLVGIKLSSKKHHFLEHKNYNKIIKNNQEQLSIGS